MARLLALFAAWISKGIVAEPIVAIAAAGAAFIVLLDNWDGVSRRVRTARAAIADSGSHLFDAVTPLVERRADAQARLKSRLEEPTLPRSIDSLCARRMATHRLPVTTSVLLDACETAGVPVDRTRLLRLLRGHPSFTASVDDSWELGRLGG